MTTVEKLVFGAVVVVVAVFGSWLVLGSHPTLLSSQGGQLVENNIPVIRMNGGYNSQLPIQTSSFVTSSTLKLTHATFCINFYATSTATALHFTASTTPTLPHGAAAVMVANYGTCTN